MMPAFVPPGAPLPDRELQPPCEAIQDAAIVLVEAIILHYPGEEESIRAGANVRITTADGIDHLIRLRSA